MIRKENHLQKMAEQRETMWEQKQATKIDKSQQFKNPHLTHPHLNLPKFHHHHLQ